MISASQARRRMAVMERSSPVSSVAAPRPSRSWSSVTVTVSRGLAPCCSGSSPSASWALKQVSTRASQVRAPWSRSVAAGFPAVGVGAGQRCGERVQRGLDDRGVLDGAATADLDAAEAVVGDGQNRPRCADRPAGPVRLLRPVRPRRGRAPRAGGRRPCADHCIERRGLVQQHPLRLVTHRRIDREPVDHRDDHLGMLRRHVTRGQRQQRRRGPRTTPAVRSSCCPCPRRPPDTEVR